MKNKLLAAPYIVWMVLFTLIPLGIVFYYALTDSMTGQFTLANLASIGTYLPIFLRSIWLSLFASLPGHRLSGGLLHRAVQAAHAALSRDAHHAPDVHELPAPHTRVGRHA